MSLLRTRLSRRLLATSAAGALADWTLFAALVATVARSTDGSVFAVAIVTCARLLPAVVIGPLLAPFAGIVGTRRTLALADAARGGVILSLPLATALPALLVALVLLETAAALSAATREAAVSQGLAPGRFAAFNTATGVVTYGMLPLGGLLAALLTQAHALAPFAVAGGLHLVDALVIGGTPEIRGRRRVGERPSLLAGVARLRRPGTLRDTVGVAACGVVAIAMLFSVGTAVAADLFGTADAYGYLLALLGVGALGGVRLAAGGAPAAAGLVLAATGSGLLALPAATAGIIGLVAVGAGAAVAYVDTQSTLQRATSAAEDFAAAFAVIKLATAGALVAAPVLYGLGGRRLVVAGMVVATVRGAVRYARRVQQRSLTAVLLVALGRPVLRACVRVRVDGRLPDGGAVLASNHPNALDGPLMMALHSRIRPVAKPQPAPLVRLALRCSGAIVTGGDTVRAAAEHVRTGGLVWLAPEGRLTGPVLGAGRTGAARVAAAAQAPVVPVFIDYGQGPGPVGSVGPRLRRWRPWRRPTVWVRVGTPLVVTAGESPAGATARLMAALSNLTGVPQAAVLAA